jgi:hypothetical protein
MERTTRPTVATDPASAPQSASANTASASGASQPGFYPLTVGNRWVYQQDVVVQLFPDSAPPPPLERSQASVVREILEPASFDGREYLVELTTTTRPGGVVDHWYSPLRQDMTGLYEWSPLVGPGVATGGSARVVAAPAGRSPAEHAAYVVAARRLEERIAVVEAALGRGGVAAFGMHLPPTTAPTEVIRLRYPLELKSQWPIRTDRRFGSSAAVVGRERLDLPAGSLLGYRIAVSSDALGPHDFVHMWYGTAGFLQQVSHYEVDAVDRGSNVIGRYVFHEVQRLQSFELVNQPPISTLPSRPPRRPK